MFRGEGIKVFYLHDLVLVPVYLTLLLIAAYLYRNVVYARSPLKKYFIPGLLVRIFGALALGVIYLFYYNGGGDTFYYFKDSYAFNLASHRSFLTMIKLFLIP